MNKHNVIEVVVIKDGDKYIYLARMEDGSSEKIRTSTRQYEGAVIYNRTVRSGAKGVAKHFTFFNGTPKINNDWICHFSTEEELLNDSPEVLTIRTV